MLGRLAPRRLPLAQREAALAVVAAVHARCDRAATLDGDPLRTAHRHPPGEDREVAAMLGALLAFGNVKAILAKLDALLHRLDDAPGRVARTSSRAELTARLRGWRHRTFGGDDVAALLFAAGERLRRDGSLFASLDACWDDTHDLREALARWVDGLRASAWPGGLDRAAKHLLPDPRGPSASKRLLLLARWAVRREDPDLGLCARLPAAALVMPLDVHVHRIARNLGFTARADASWTTALEITDALRPLAPDDPVRFDMALCHVGISMRCPSKRDPVRCEGCALRSVCRHWWPTQPRRVSPPSPRA